MRDRESDEREPIDREDVGAMLRMIVHDVRNPIATLLANLEVLGSVEPDDPEVPEILADLRTATRELDDGMRALGWLGRWLAGSPAVEPSVGDVVAPVRSMVTVPVQAPTGPLNAKGGAGAGEMAAVLVACALRYGRSALVRIEDHDDGVIVSVSDPGTPIAPADREALFDLRGHLQLKQASRARYARFLGLPAIAAAVRDIGGSTWVDERDGRCLFAFMLPKG